MRSEIIAVGSELLVFGRTETNSLLIASRLVSLGFSVPRKFVAADSEVEILECLSLALARSDVVLLTGGLGPTNDDVTRESVARFLDRALVEDPEILRTLEQRARQFRFSLTPNNRRQAQVPEGATVLPNANGTAPGLCLESDGKLVFLLPGPPRELTPMLDEQVLPLIRRHFPTKPSLNRRLKVAGEAESRVDHRIGKIYQAYPEVETTILSSPGIISLYFTWKGNGDEARGHRILEELVGRIEEALGKSVYSHEEESLSEALGRLLRSRALTLAAAESCTGGMLGELITEVPGSSDYFLGSVVTYSNQAKAGLLGVNPQKIAQLGAVSGEVAEQMATGARDALGASIAVSTTGIAGPGGGTEEKPVGTVYLGLSTAKETRSKKLFLPGNREAVRLRSCNLALDWIRREIS
ncbi:MAG: competence/damage-inducible protein A [Acidobacteriota bacterium]|jgi:nicotinamide-nucleotide amidase